jgi:hypothetical protein
MGSDGSAINMSLKMIVYMIFFSYKECNLGSITLYINSFIESKSTRVSKFDCIKNITVQFSNHRQIEVFIKDQENTRLYTISRMH